MASQSPLLAVLASPGGLAFGVYILRWTIASLWKGELRYRFQRADRRTCPSYFWFAVVWGLVAGLCLLLGGLTVLYHVLVR
jgi:hypothetical protein